MSGDVAVVVLAFGPEPHLGDCLRSVLAACDAGGSDVDVVLVDNGADPASLAAVPTDPRLRTLRPGTNTGFAGGCNLAVAATDAPTVFFVNSDVTLDPQALERLLAALDRDPGLGPVCGSLRLADAPDRLNALGVEVGYVGLAWAACLDEPAADHPDPVDVTCVSGGFFGLRRAVWDELGGFDEGYFAYHEDVDLSLRSWGRGRRVGYVPDAIALHVYEFGRNPSKLHLLERNRWQTVLTNYPPRVLHRALPAMVVFDLLLAVVAAQQGWLGQKLSAWRWLLTHRRYLLARRRSVQAAASIGDAEFAALLRPDVAAPVLGDSALLVLLNRGLRAYWSVAVRGLGRDPTVRTS